MGSIVNNQFRVFSAAEFTRYHKQTSSPLYIAVGKSDEWANTHPESLDNTLNERTLFIDNVIGMQKIKPDDIVPVVRLHTWSDDETDYNIYDTNDENAQHSKFYTLNSEGRVYKCLSIGVATSQEPTGLTTITTSDNFEWEYIYSLKSGDYDEYTKTMWMPIYYEEYSSQEQIDHGDIMAHKTFGSSMILIKSKLTDVGIPVNTEYRQIGYISRPTDSNCDPILDEFPNISDINTDNLDVIHIENKYKCERKIGKWEKISSILSI